MDLMRRKRRPSRKVRLRLKRKRALDTKEERTEGEKPKEVHKESSLEDLCIVILNRKRCPYISQKDLRDKDSSQSVGEVIMRMSPRQLKTRCTHNEVH